MLGKANRIKARYISGFTLITVSDCDIPENAEIIDIKFSTCMEQGYGIRESALIIYKEAEPVDE